MVGKGGRTLVIGSFSRPLMLFTTVASSLPLILLCLLLLLRRLDSSGWADGSLCWLCNGHNIENYSSFILLLLRRDPSGWDDGGLFWLC